VGAVRGSTTTGGRWSLKESGLHIHELELQAVCFRLKSLCDDISNSHIRVISDNATTVCYNHNMGGSKLWSCNENFALHRNNFLSAAHLAGKQNELADREFRAFN